MPLIGSDGRLELPWTSGEAVRGLDFLQLMLNSCVAFLVGGLIQQESLKALLECHHKLDWTIFQHKTRQQSREATSIVCRTATWILRSDD